MRGKLVIFVLWLAAFFQTSAFTPAPLNISADRPISGFGFEDAFPGIRFEQPVALTSAPGETNRVFVVERRGIIWAITNLAQPSQSVFLDLSQATIWDLPFNECGMLGLAFHPGFATNWYFFVYRIWYNGGQYGRDTLSRFKISADGATADPSSEFVLLAQRDIEIVHNSGCLRFGPDGYLYFSIGVDGPPPELQSTELQAIDKGMFGGVFRIDVDNRPGNLTPNAHPDITPGAYKIPADNPWVGATSFLGKPVDPTTVRTEFYAVGLRNPWQFSIDSLTGEIYCGDVGEQTIEEINLIQPGRNYGWPFMEGTLLRSPDAPADQFTLPLFEYTHGMGTNTGSAAIGGFVVRNDNYPGLNGAYVFGDFGSGNVWSLRRDPAVNVEWIAREPGLAAFAEDPSNGDLLVINVGEGAIRRLVYTEPENSSVPQQLSQTGIFTDVANLSIAPGYQPYDINVTFWSDGARKQRWFGLTDANTRYGFAPDGDWNFPDGAVWVKHFELETIKGDPTSARRLETRVLIKRQDQVYGYTYRWGDSMTDAQLVPSVGLDEPIQIDDHGTIRTQIWHYPGRGECHACHSKNAGFAAGFNTSQLNHVATHDGATRNELTRLAELGYLDRDSVEPTQLRSLASQDDLSQPLEHRVKSFFAANCSICHRPEGLPIKARWDARITTPLESAGIVNGTLSQPFWDWNYDRVVAWRNVTNSVLLLRMQNFDPWTYHMPPFATTVVNDAAVQMLSDWINALPDPTWTRKQVGQAQLFGSVSQPAGSLILSGSGAGAVDGPGESLYFNYQRVTNNFQITARLHNLSTNVPGASAGIMARIGDQPGAPLAGVIQTAQLQSDFISRTNGGGMSTIASGAGVSRPWQRLIRDGSVVQAFDSADGLDWTLIGSSEGWSQPDVALGFSIWSGDAWTYASAEFQDYAISAVTLKTAASHYAAPTTIALSAEVAAINTTPQKVEFWASGQFLGSADQAPWSIQWTNALAGDYELRATLWTADGISVTSAPVTVSVTAEAPAAVLYLSSASESSIWQGAFGRVGYALPDVATNLPAGAQFAATGQILGWSPDGILYPLETPTGELAATAWADTNHLSLNFSPPFEDPYLITLYLTDYQHEGCELEVTVTSPDGTILDDRVEGNFVAPQYVSWAARGQIAIDLRSLNDRNVYVSGVFLDPLPPNRVTLTSPADGSHISLPGSIGLAAQAIAEAAALRRVDFLCDGTRFGSTTNAPYEMTWTNALAGDHSLAAVAIGYFGRSVTSTPVSIHCELPATEVTFLGINGAVKGDWSQAFGADGFSIPGAVEQFRPFVHATFAVGLPVYIWASDSSDPRALRLMDQDSAIASCWHSDLTSEGNIEFLDGREHTVSLYFLDYERVGASEFLQVIDPDSNAVLDQRLLDDIGEGIYLSWNVRGKARFRLDPRSVWNTVVSGMFVGGPITRSQKWWAENFGGDLLATPRWTEDPDADGRPNFVEYALGSDPFAGDEPLNIRSELQGTLLTTEISAARIAADARISMETSTNLQNWQAASSERADGDGTVRFTTPMIEAGPHFYRLRFDPP